MRDGSVGSSPGWYPDPAGQHELRYHNGQRWTGDVSTDGTRHVSPLGDNDGSPSASGPSGTLALVLGLVSMAVGWIPFVSVGAAGMAIAAIVIGLRRRHRPNARGASQAGIVTGAVGLLFACLGTWFTVVLVGAINRYEDPGDYRIDDLTCIEIDDVTRASGTITNLEAGSRSYTVEISFDGERSETTEIDDVAGGASQSFVVDEDFRFDDLVCEVSSVNGPRPFGIDTGT